MAGEFAKFYIRLGTLFDPKGLNDAKAQIKGTDKSVGGLSSAVGKLGAMFAGGAAIYKLISFAKEAWAAYAKQEEVTARLNQALRSQGIYSAELSNSLQKLASDIQKVTTVGDEDTLALIQLGLSMGVAAGKMRQATEAAIGLSKAYGVDLNSAMKMVALATQGEYTMLARYIPQLRTLTDETQKAALVTKLLADGFNLAKAEALTASGGVKSLANRFGDLKEEIGRWLVPAVELYTKWINKALEATEKLFKSEEKASTAGLSRNEKVLAGLKEQIALQKKLNDQMPTAWRTAPDWTPGHKAYLEGSQKIFNLTKAKLDLEAKMPKTTAPAAPVAGPLFGAEKALTYGPTIEQLREVAKDRLNKVDKWYLSEKGTEETKFYQWLHESKINWDQMDMVQQEATMLRVQETYKRANASMTGSFLVSIDRMKAAGMGWAQEWDGMWGATLSGMTANVKTFLTASGNMFDNFRKMLDGFFKSILSAFIDMVAKMIAKWLLLQAVTGLFPAGGFFMTLLGSKKDGGPINETGPYLLHKGEEVIPADIASSIRKNPGPSFTPTAAGAGAAPPVTVNQEITIGGTSETDISVIAARLSEATRNGVLSAVDLAKVNYKVGQRRAGETAL